MMESANQNITKEPVSKYAHTVAAVIVVVWLVASFFAFWWFEFRHFDRFTNSLAQFNGEKMAQLNYIPIDNRATVVHFVDENCPCTRFSKPHIKRLESKFTDNTQFYYAENAPAVLKDALKAIPINVSPAVAIWSAKGELAYFGPYSGGAVCGQGTDFVTAILNSIDTITQDTWITQEAIGCFCPWSQSQEVLS